MLNAEWPWLQSAISNQQSAVSSQQSTIHHPPSTIGNHQNQQSAFDNQHSDASPYPAAVSAAERRAVPERVSAAAHLRTALPTDGGRRARRRSNHRDGAASSRMGG